ncbi:MAG: hypothetical protein EXR77_16540 [Myxococcales bacterium]|nr:hypothetical protein [Myxococcales bacterium]
MPSPWKHHVLMLIGIAGSAHCSGADRPIPGADGQATIGVDAAADGGIAASDAARTTADGAAGTAVVGAVKSQGFNSGTRLLARQWLAPGTEPHSLAVFDSGRKQDCTFRLATDGQLRCLPPHTAFVTTSYYADPAHQQQAYVRTQNEICSDSSGDYLTRPAPRTACAVPQTYEVLALVPTTTALYDYGGKPVAQPPPGVYVASQVVSPAEWVAGTEHLQATAGRFSLRQIDSADGGRFTIGLFDTSLQVPCSLYESHSYNVLRCRLPRAETSSHQYFADPECKVQLATAVEDDGCATPYEVGGEPYGLAIGKKWSDPVYEQLGHDKCGVAKVAPTLQLYAIGKALPKDVTATLQYGVEGQGNMRRKTLLDWQGTVLPLPLGDVDAFGSPYLAGELLCHPVSSAGHGLRCAPHGTCFLSQGYFSDPNCKQAVTQCKGVKGPIIRTNHQNGCYAVAALGLFKQLAEVTGSKLFYADLSKKKCVFGGHDPTNVYTPVGSKLNAVEEGAFWDTLPPIGLQFAPSSPAP